jgi:hypothetical protein
MRVRWIVAWLAFALGATSLAMRELQARPSTREEWQQMESLTGRTIRWRFDDGPVAGITFEHVFHEDGGVTWRYVDGDDKGASAREKSYTAVKVNARTWVVSYLAASGHTLTTVLDTEDGRAFGFASDEKSSHSFRGTFELVR